MFCPYFVYIRLLVTSLVYFSHCIVRTSSIYGFWLLLWYILVIVLSVLRLFTTSDYFFGILWSLYCPYFVYLRLLITPLVYFGHCIVRTSSIYDLWLPLWYILVIVLSVFHLFKTYDYSFGIFWWLYCPHVVYLRLMNTHLIYFVHCIVRISSIYDLWLLLWYILVIVLSVFRLFTASDYSFGIFWSFYCSYFVYLRLMITPLVYFGHFIVRISSIYDLWLLLWYILVIVLSVFRLFTTYDYSFGIFWSFYCPYFVYLRLMITSLVYFGHCIVRISSIYDLWYYSFGIFWSFYCPYVVYLRLMITPLVYFGHCIVRISSIYDLWLLLLYILVILLSVFRLFTAYDYFFGIFWSLYFPYFVYLRLMITPLVNFGHFIVRISSIYDLWLLLWYILVIVLSVLRLFTTYDYCFGIFWSFYCPYFVYLRLLITPLVYFGHFIVRTSSIYDLWLLLGIFWSLYCPYFVYLRLMITPLVYFGHFIVRISSIYGLWLPLWYILVIVLSVFRLFTTYDYSFGIFWSFYCQYCVYLRLMITPVVYFGHFIVRISSIYDLWLLLWYILVIVLSVLRLFTASDYFFDIFWSLYCPYFVYLRLMITPLVYFGHCIVRISSIYDLWLLLWYILVIVLSVRRLFTIYDYSLGIFWWLYCPYFVYLRLMITPLIYFGHFIFRTSSIYDIWLLLWYILFILLSIRRLFTASDYSFGIFWSLYCPYVVYLRFMITPLVYFGHCIVRTSSIYCFWLLLWYILVIVLSVLRLFTASDYSFGIFWSLYFPYVVYLRLMITPLIYFGHCIVRTSSIYDIWLLLWYILVILLSIRRLFTASDYSFGIFWSLYCPYVVYLRFMITPLVYFGHCIVRTSSIYCFWLLLWYILVIVLSVLRLFTASDYSFGIFWSLYFPYVVYLRLMITPLIYFGHCIVRTSSIYDLWLLLWYILVIVLSVRRLFTASDYSFGIFWSLYCPYFVYLRLMITPLVYFGHCIVRTSSIYDLWLLPWYILVIVLSAFRLFTTYDYSFDIFWSFYFPYVVYLRHMITSLVYFGRFIVVRRLFTASDYSFGIFWSLYCPYVVYLRFMITRLVYFGHCIVRTSSIYCFWLLLWYILVIVLSVLRLFTASDYSFGIFWSLYCPYVVYLRLMITPLIYFGHCIVRTSSIYDLWLLLWYILVIVLSVRRLFTTSDYSFGIFWSLYCPYFVYLRLMITPLIYFGHCIVRISSIYDLWLLFWYILVIVLSELRLFTASDYFFGIFWSLYCPYCVYLRLLVTSLVYFGHCVVHTSSIYGLWLLLWYILVIVLSVRRLFTTYDYSFDIFWSLYCPYVVYLRLMITPLVYFGHCIVRISSIYDLWLLPWYILVIVLSVFRLLTTSDYSFGIFWSFYCPYFVYLRLMITHLVYVGHCIVSTASIDDLWLLLWYILVILLSVFRLFTAYDYFFGIFWSFYCPYVVYLRLMITPLVYFGHCIVRISSIYDLWLLLWYILVILLSVFRLFTAYDYFFGIFWSLYCPYFVYLRLMITPLVYFGHFIVRISSIYDLWLLLWYILVIVWSVLRLFTTYDYTFGIFWSFYFPYFVYLRLMITPLVYFGHCIVRTSSIYDLWLLLWYILVIVLSVFRLFTTYDYCFGIFWLFYCPYFVYLRLWLLLWYILVIVLSVFRLFTTYDYSFGIFWSFYCQYCVYLRHMITPLVYFGHCIVRISSIYHLWLLLWYILVIVLSVRRLFTIYDYSLGIFWWLYCPYFVYLRLMITPLIYFGHFIVRTSSIYDIWLLLWYILVILLFVRRLFTIYGYSFGIFWSLYCPYFVYLLFLITSLVYFGHCIVRTSSIYDFWLLLWYILVIVLSVRRLFTTYDYSFDIFWSLYCPYVVYLRLMITPLIYFGHCIVRTSSIYGFWLLLWYILVIVLSVFRLFTTYDYSFDIFWSLYCPYFVYLRLMITPLVYFGHCIVRTASIYGFWLLLWYILVIVLSVFRLFTTYDYSFGIFWSLYCPYVVYLRLMITPLIYFGDCIVRISSIYGFWLLLWYILVIVLSVFRLFTTNDYFFGIFWSLYCPYFVYLRLMITPLVYFGHCIVSTASIYDLWLLLWYILVILLSVFRLFTAYDYSFGIFWSFYCPYVVYLRLMITPLVYFGHCIVRISSIYDLWFRIPLVYFGHFIVRISSIYGLWLLLWYIWSLYCPYFVYLRLMITPLVYFGHFIVSTASIYDLWLLLWYILVILLSVFRLFTTYDYSFGIFWSLYCQYCVYLRLLITSLIYFGHYIVRISSIYDLWLLLWYILVIVLSVVRLFTTSDYSFGIFWSLYCPYVVYLRFMITPLVYFSDCIVVFRLFTTYDYSFDIFWSFYCPYVVYLRHMITSLVYFGHFIVRTSSIYASDYSFGIFWSLYCPYVVYLRFMITPLVYCGHCIVRTSSIYGFWLLLWYILVIVLSVLRLFTASDYSFGIFWSLYCPYVVYLRLMITPLIYFGHCIVRTSSIYDLWLLLWYILVIVLSVRRLFTASDFSFGIFWSLYCPYFVYLRLMITPLVYFGHCIVRTSSIYDLWLLPWYILVIVLSVFRLFTTYDYSFDIFWSFYFPYVVYLRHMITSLVYFGHFIVRTSSIYASDYSFGIFWSLYCPYVVYLRFMITPLVYFGHCIVRTSSIYCFWLLLWYILVIVLSVLRLFTASDYSFGIFWSLYCPYVVYLRLMITPLVYFGHCIVVLRLFTTYDYSFDIFWSLYCPYVVYLLLWYILVILFVYLRLLLWYILVIVLSVLRLFTFLITSLVYFGHCIVRTSSIYDFWLLLWYILVIVLSVRRIFTTYDYSFDIFWSLYCPYVVYLRLMITPLIYFGHCIVRTSSIYGFWLLLWYILVIVLSVFRLFTTYDYSFDIFWSLYCPYFVYLRLMITPLVYFGHCIVRTASIYGFWLLLWYILVIVLSVLRLFTAYDYSFGIFWSLYCPYVVVSFDIFWSLYCPYVVYLRLMITPLIYFGHCIVRTSSIYGFWLLLWYILVIVLSVFRLFTTYDYSFDIFWSLYCPYFVYLRLMITPLVYFGHCIVRTASIYGFWLLLWYILVIVLSVFRLFTASDYSFGIFWSLYCPYFVYLRLMITSLVYFGHCIVRISSIYDLWLLLWYILVILLSVFRLFTTYDYSFGIFWSLYCQYCVYLRLMITPLVYFGHFIVRISSIYGLWLLLWYILVILLSVRRLFTTYDYSFGIFWSLYCPYFVYLRLMITPLVYFGHFIVRISSIYGLWLLPWYIWSLYCPYFVYLRLMITPLVYFGHFIVSTASIYDLWLLLWYILGILLSVFRLFTTYDYSFGIFWSLYCQYCVYLRLLIISLIYFGHYIVRISTIYDLWLLLWYILVIVLSVVRLFTTSDYSFGIFWSLYCPYVVYLRFMITPLVYFGDCIVVFRLFTTYDYSFDIFWSFYCPYVVYLRHMITSLVYFGHFIVRTSSIYGFWLLLWYILVIVLSVRRLFTIYDYSFGIFWSLYCPYFVYLRLLITSLVYFGHCIVRTSSIYGFWLLLWYILVIVLSVRRLFTTYDYSFDIFWSLYCPYVV